jgi:hypothetical protein
MHPKSKSDVHNWMPAELKAWLDGELSVPRIVMVRAHLLVCPACREEVTWLKRLGEDMRDLERAVPNPRLRGRILAALPETPPGRPAPADDPSRNWVRLAPAFATATVVAFAAILIAMIHNSSAVDSDRTAQQSVAKNPYTAPELPVASGSGPSRASQPPHRSDPYSDYADRMLAQYLRDEENKSAILLARNRTNWNGFVAALSNEKKIAQSGGALTLAVAVPDVNAAESALTSWAKAAGGSVAGSEATGPAASVAPTVTTNEQSSPSVSGDQAIHGRLLALRIPASKIATLEPVLSKLGAWGANKHEKSSAISQPAAIVRTVSATPRPGSPADAHLNDPVAPTGAPGSATVSRTAATEQVSGRDGEGSFLTVRFQLTSLGGLAP